MSATPSLRRRIVAGALSWTLGLLLVVSAALAALVEHQGHAAALVHGALAHTAVVIVLAAGLLAGGVWLVGRGLASLTTLRQRLRDVWHGEAARVEGAYPVEVQPLVDDLNALLAHRDDALRRAQARAGDLAHGLKTPLAILAHEAQRLAADGQTERAASLDEQIGRMRRQVGYHLAYARAAASGRSGRVTAHTLVAPVVATLVRTVSHLYVERQLAFEVDVADDHRVRCAREDLEEMLGNLLDNACKWTRSRVRVTSHATREGLDLLVEDDGAGLGAGDAEEALRRGRRLDEAVPGSGLGLAITRDLAELHGGSIRLERSALGGVAAWLRLPEG